MTRFAFLSSDIEFILVHFHLEFQERFRLSTAEILRLRRDILIAARNFLGYRSSERFQTLFDPPLPVDPVALRKFQRPGPPFAILPDPGMAGVYDVGDRLEITATFWGRGGHALADFAHVLQTLGKSGFYRGQGSFELAAIEAEDASGNRTLVWSEGEDLHLLAPPVNEVDWWLSRGGTPTSVLLEFLTPARLISQGRPLFKVNFDRLFPFILRRVTSMIYAHCGREVIADLSRLLAAAAQVCEQENSLCWQD